MSKLKILELFGGIGACSKALERLGVEYEIADYVEIDKYAVKSFNAIHNTNFEPQDVCDWNKNIEVDLIMHGSPCQDFSIAGKQKGGDEGSGTRSSLMYETIRIVEKLKPKYVIWENVKNLLSKKHIHNFNAYLETMEQLGYKNYYQVLNAKDYGIPQNRERVFTVSIRDDSGIKKGAFLGTFYLEDYDANNFKIPPKQELKLKLKDMLENEVDEKYYLNDEQISRIKTSTYIQNQRRIQEKEYCDTSCAKDWKDPKCVEVNRKYGLFDTEKSKHQAGSVYDENGLSPTLDTMQGGWRQPCIEIKNNTKKSYLPAYEGDGVNISSRMKYQRGNVQKESIQTLTTSGGNDRGVVVNEPMIYDDRDKGWGIKITDICPTQRAMRTGIKCIYPGLRIRKLTPKECWRLMGFDDEDFEKAEKVNSNTQLYKQAGNSIVVNVLEAIFKNLL